MKTIKTNPIASMSWAQELTRAEYLFQLIPLLKKMPPIEVSDVFLMVENDILNLLFKEFSPRFQAEVFNHFSLEKQLSYFQYISKRQFAELFETMTSQERSDWFQILTEQEQLDLLPFISQRNGEILLSWSSYKTRLQNKKNKQVLL